MASVVRRIWRTIVHRTLRIGKQGFRNRGSAWRQKRWIQAGKDGVHWQDAETKISGPRL